MSYLYPWRAYSAINLLVAPNISPALITLANDETWGDKSDSDYEFVNNNLTLIDNSTAIQMEFIGKKGTNSENEHYIYLITEVDDIFYEIQYWIDDERYRSYLPEVKKIIDSIQFIEMDKPKRPSFM